MNRNYLGIYIDFGAQDFYCTVPFQLIGQDKTIKICLYAPSGCLADSVCIHFPQWLIISFISSISSLASNHGKMLRDQWWSRSPTLSDSGPCYSCGTSQKTAHMCLLSSCGAECFSILSSLQCQAQCMHYNHSGNIFSTACFISDSSEQEVPPPPPTLFNFLQESDCWHLCNKYSALTRLTWPQLPLNRCGPSDLSISGSSAWFPEENLWS